MRKYFCEATGTLSRFDLDPKDIAHATRLFSSELAEQQHKEREKVNDGITLAHYRCFDWDGYQDIQSVLYNVEEFVWAQNNPGLAPKRYRLYAGFRLFEECMVKDRLVPFFVIPETYNDPGRIIRLVTNWEYGDHDHDPFKFAELIEELSKIGKTVKGRYWKLSETKDLPRLLGLSQQHIHYKRKLAHAADVIRQAVENGTLGVSKACEICRLPKKNQASMIQRSVDTGLSDVRGMVSQELLDTGDEKGWSGRLRTQIKPTSERYRRRLRTLKEIGKMERKYQKLYDKKPSSMLLRGRLQAIQWIVSILDDIEDDPML